MRSMITIVDMSGSMLGQRFEIAKQTTEAILETLSHNDYFNMMTVSDSFPSRVLNLSSFQFSKEVKFLDSCNGTSGLLQATMRNKKDLRFVTKLMRKLMKCNAQTNFGMHARKFFITENDWTSPHPRGRPNTRLH